MKYFQPFPRFKGSAVQKASSRGAMGYPDAYTQSRFDTVSQEFNRLRTLNPSQLVDVLEDKMLTLETRYAAGSLLALVGDPRLETLKPQMIAIPGAEVSIGLPKERVAQVFSELEKLGVLKEWIEKEAPSFKTSLKPFQIAKFPVTNQEYRDFLLETEYPEIPTAWAFGKYPFLKANHPVYTVSAEAADAYAKWLTEKTGAVYRLPTEAEWEYAAGGPKALEYPWGEKFLPDHANTVEMGILSSTPVGMFSEGNSPFGVCDMAGNVEEYVADLYWLYPGSLAPEDDLCLANQKYRVARGGSFTRFYDLARCKRRHGRYPKDIYVMGFRVVSQ